MKSAKFKIFPVLVILFSIIIGAYFYPKMPLLIASHWGADGQVNGYMTKFWGLFFMPLISIILYFLFIFLPYADPYKKNFKKFEKYFNNFINVIFIFLFYIYLITIFWNLGNRFNMIQILSPAFSLMYIFAGFLLAKTRRNWFVGIRTPWTISSKLVWKKTHALGAKLFIIAGILSLLSLFLPQYSLAFVLYPIIVFSIFLFVYSYVIFRQI